MSLNKIEISDRTIVKTILWAVLFYSLFYFRSLVLVLFLSVLIASLVDRLVNLLKRVKIPRVVTVIVFYIVMIGLFLLLMYNIIPKSVAYIASTISQLPDILNSLKSLHPDSSLWYSNFLSYVIEWVKTIDVNSLMSGMKTKLLTGSLSTSANFLSFALDAVLTIVISFYISLTEKGVQNFLKLISPKKYENYVVGLFDRVHKKISNWFFGQVMVAFIVGLLVYLILIILNIPFAIYIALLAFVFEILPIAGVVTASIPALFLAWNMGGYSLAILLLVLFFIVSQISSYILYPKIVGKFVGLPTVIIIIAVFVGVEVGGFWGALISIPVATIVMEILEDFKRLKENQN